MKNKNVYIIAGPNGSGKTTFAKEFLPLYAHCENFVNADLIAQGLSPFSPSVAAMKAGRLVLEQIRGFADKGVDFAFESTLAGKTYASFFKAVKRKGYRIHLFFLWIPNSSLALERIKDRVASGGHDVPASDVHRRFRRSVENFFKVYEPLLDSWMLFDNSNEIPYLVAEKADGKLLIKDVQLYNEISKGKRNGG